MQRGVAGLSPSPDMRCRCNIQVFRASTWLSGETWGANGMWGVMDWIVKGNNAVRQRVAELAQSSESEHVRDQAALMLEIVDGRLETRYAGR